MDIIGGISAATEGLKLVNELRKIDAKVDKAELKIRLVDLADRLLDAKQALQDAKENEQSLRQQISKLENAASHRAQMEDEGGRLYELDSAGRRIGEPFCNLCHVREDKLYRLKFFGGAKDPYYQCDNCKTPCYV